MISPKQHTFVSRFNSNPAINAILHVKYNSYNYEFEFIARCSKSIHLDTFFFKKLIKFLYTCNAILYSFV